MSKMPIVYNRDLAFSLGIAHNLLLWVQVFSPGDDLLVEYCPWYKTSTINLALAKRHIASSVEQYPCGTLATEDVVVGASVGAVVCGVLVPTVTLQKTEDHRMILRDALRLFNADLSLERFPGQFSESVQHCTVKRIVLACQKSIGARLWHQLVPVGVVVVMGVAVRLTGRRRVDRSERVDFDAQMSSNNLHKLLVGEIREVKLHVDEPARCDMFCGNMLENRAWILVVDGKDAAMRIG